MAALIAAGWLDASADLLQQPRCQPDRGCDVRSPCGGLIRSRFERSPSHRAHAVAPEQAPFKGRRVCWLRSFLRARLVPDRLNRVCPGYQQQNLARPDPLVLLFCRRVASPASTAPSTNQEVVISERSSKAFHGVVDVSRWPRTGTS